MIKNITLVISQELLLYQKSTISWFFIIAFVILANLITFDLGNFFARNQADLYSFFSHHTWLYLFFIPMLSLRQWSDEKSCHSIELLLTLPISKAHLVLGKFFAGWIIIGMTLLCTTTLWITVYYLGEPDHNIILTNYLGSWIIGGAYLAIGSFISIVAKNIIIAYLGTFLTCLTFLNADLPLIQKITYTLLPEYWHELLYRISLTSHYDSFTRGLIDIGDLLYFTIFISLWLQSAIIILKKYNH